MSAFNLQISGGKSDGSVNSATSADIYFFALK